MFNQSTGQVLVDGQDVPGSVLDAERLQKKHHNSCVTGQSDSHIENSENRDKGVHLLSRKEVGLVEIRP